MTAPRVYNAPADLQRALEARIRTVAQNTGRPHNSVRQRVLFERVLERIHAHIPSDAWVLKGGLALELRIQRARTTIDIDLSVQGSVDDATERIRDALGLYATGDAGPSTTLDRFLTFTITQEQALEVVKDYAARRVTIQAHIGGRKYGGAFHIDIASGDILTGCPDIVQNPSFFEFLGGTPVAYRLYPLATHLAEKVHALTLPRERDNSRLKDLIDIALILDLDVDDAAAKRALAATFKHRATHALPAALPTSPPTWATRYPRERARTFPWLPWTSLAEVESRVSDRLDPLLTALATEQPPT